MVNYDKTKNEIRLVQKLTLDDALWLINKAKEHFQDVLDEDCETGDNAKKIQSFLDWDPKTEPTPCYDGTKEDMMQFIADEISSSEDGEFFDLQDCFKSALAEWLSDEFDYEMIPGAIFPEF